MADTFFKQMTEEKTEVTRPKMYKVLLHNDDYTTMDFVVEVLITIFHKSVADATKRNNFV